MTEEKITKYKLRGSIHTLQLSVDGIVRPDQNVSKCVESYSQCKDGIKSKVKINPNKLCGDIFSYDEFKTALDTILVNSGIYEYSIVRADFRLDNYDPTHYKDFIKLNRLIVSLLAVTYNVKNCYKTSDLFTDAQLSVAIKNKRFETEVYDKIAEQKNNGGHDIATSRLELRSKDFKNSELRKEFTEHWFLRWNKALLNLDNVLERYNTELLKSYCEQKHSFPKTFRTLADFIMKNESRIFTREQFLNFIYATGDCKDPRDYLKWYNKRYGFEFINEKDVIYATAEIKQAILNFFGS